MILAVKGILEYTGLSHEVNQHDWHVENAGDVRRDDGSGHELQAVGLRSVMRHHPRLCWDVVSCPSFAEITSFLF